MVIFMMMFWGFNWEFLWWNVQGQRSGLMGASPTADGPRWGEEEGTRLLEDVSGGDDDDTVSDDNHNENLFQKNVVDYIRICGNLADTYSDDEIHRAIGILRYILNAQASRSKFIEEIQSDNRQDQCVSSWARLHESCGKGSPKKTGLFENVLKNW